jgi:hypothetical protein
MELGLLKKCLELEFYPDDDESSTEEKEEA